MMNQDNNNSMMNQDNNNSMIDNNNTMMDMDNNNTMSPLQRAKFIVELLKHHEELWKRRDGITRIAVGVDISASEMKQRGEALRNRLLGKTQISPEEATKGSKQYTVVVNVRSDSPCHEHYGLPAHCAGILIKLQPSQCLKEKALCYFETFDDV